VALEACLAPDLLLVVMRMDLRLIPLVLRMTLGGLDP
jgi:hypothetical protein